MRVFFARWVPIGILVGLFTGGLVSLLHVVIYDYGWVFFRGLYATKPWLVFVVLPCGFLISALLVRGLNPRRYSHGTEEVLNAYHTPGIQVRSLPYLRRAAGAWSTIAAGGSAGLEGPAILTGAWFASWFVRHFKFWTFEEEDRRVLLLVGAAAGVAAIFRAPFTGLLFSLELPYKGDIAKNAFVPGLLASATSYLTFVFFVSPEPIFDFTTTADLRLRDLAWSLVIGLACGILAWAFVKLNKLTRATFRHPKLPWEAGALSGGFIVAILGYASIELFDAPIALGPGYDTIKDLFHGSFLLKGLLLFLALKVATTLFTLGTYGAGGIFFQSFLIGGIVGAVLHAALVLQGLYSGEAGFFVTAGMASFLAAAYKTPIAATAFVAEGSGSPSFLIPAFVASAVAYVVSGSTSISEAQQDPVRVRYDALEGLKVRDAMQTGVVTVPSNLTVDQFLNDWVLRYRHVAYPVTTEGELVGWITLEHASAFPPEARKLAHVADGMSKTIPMAGPDEPLREVLRRMQKGGTSRVLVTDGRTPARVLGILAEADLLRLVELRGSKTAG
ncbi:MAG TPA: chloride channel protein [Candidatus Thermoplasmatota archaeon]|nr:chloride channel protein [Candidatus Thermoplasmatota archaeon]